MEEIAEVRQSNSDFKPKIIGFLCNWCSYAGADLCGVLRYQYPTDLRVIRVMCSTRIDPYIIINIFRHGADGVFIGGCHLGDCHYLTGNYHTINKVNMTRQLLEHAGINPERLRVEWISASEGERFSKVITEFTEKIHELGSSELCGEEKDCKLSTNLSGAERAALNFQLRALVGREYNLIQEGNIYGEPVDASELEAVIRNALEAEYLRGVILDLTAKNPRSVGELAVALDRPKHEVLKHIIALQGSNLLAIDKIKDHIPVYSAVTFGEE